MKLEMPEVPHGRGRALAAAIEPHDSGARDGTRAGGFGHDLPRLLAAALALCAAFVSAMWSAGSAMPAAQTWLLCAAAVVGAYMAMNIGANDVANNMGPAVGSGTLTLGWALAIAATFETLGAVVAGGEVVHTIKSDIIDTTRMTVPLDGLMLAALLAAALWLNLATALGAPVSTTHSIVGAVMGAGFAAGGSTLINWSTAGAVFVSWVVSPLMGAVLAAAVLYAIKRSITWQRDMTAAAARVVPLLIAAMAWAFGTYMLTQGIGPLLELEPLTANACGAALAGLAYATVRAPVARAALAQPNDKQGVNNLFTWPLVCAAALLSFAHGANDVANAIAPLAAIHERLAGSTPAATPLWILLLGGLGLALGLALYGGKLIRTVGHEITELDRMRAYAIAMSAALTVIVATQLGMPVSTTHVAIGAVFGIGFLREHLKHRRAPPGARPVLVHRGQCLRIVAAWLVTVPATALLAGLGYWLWECFA